jgi:hypothetical protein
MCADTLNILTDDGKTVHEGDTVFSHYTCKWGVITNAKDTRYDDSAINPHQDVWFDLKYDDGTSDYLNGQRIATHKPAWMR